MVANPATGNPPSRSSNDEAPEVPLVPLVLLVPFVPLVLLVPLVLPGALPSRLDSFGSLVKLALTPVPLVQVELTALLAPETKLTAAHCASYS